MTDASVRRRSVGECCTITDCINDAAQSEIGTIWPLCPKHRSDFDAWKKAQHGRLLSADS